MANTEIGSLYHKDGTPLLRMWHADVPPLWRRVVRHSHLAFEIMLVREGSGVYTVGERKYPVTAGDMFVFASNEQHSITEAGHGGLRITNLHFEPRLLWGSAPDRMSEENADLCFSHSQGFENRIEAPRACALSAHFTAIERELCDKNSEYALCVRSHLNFLLITLVRDYGYRDGSGVFNRQRVHLFRRLLTYIDEHISEELTLDKLASVTGVTPNYLSSLFSKTSGISLWEHITSRRVQTAMRLLDEDSGKTVLEIALLSGFNNTANFNKSFRRITGMTPSEYRKNGYTLS